MYITTLKSKIAYATISDANLFYEGSFGIDEDYLKKANILPNEQIHIVNVNNGERFVTYAIPMPAGSQSFDLNGAAARKGVVGDEVIIITYATIDPTNEILTPIVIHCNHGPKTPR